ncbi:hypothetical protein GOP47_0013273 [Adiantum capillus-veneris]|uniref:WIYLD domain-containing protein n=1 Tax=Adiantum capillus-veneris TaxID=13818 RepID=A0A9D4UP54_ADICA|nr:hypothetical protein GOP47_0013273 [Adiantum capillus-veneris]
MEQRLLSCFPKETDEDSSKLEFEVAVSVLLEYGFSKAIIKRTLKNILRVYAGNDAWPLIKENGYEVVIERLISDDGSRQRKSQRKAEHGLEKERKQHNVEVDPGKAGGLSGANASSSSSLLVTPTFDTENIDIQSHQRILWTKNGSFSLPEWCKAFNVQNKIKQQKVVDLHVLLERSDKGCSVQGHDVNYCASDVLAVKDENSDCIEEVRNVSFSKIKVVKNEDAIHTADLTDEGLVGTLTDKISNGHLQSFKCPEILQNSDYDTGPQQQESDSTILKTPKFADSVHTDHAEACLQQSSPAMPQTQKLADVVPLQHDVNPAALEAKGTKSFQRKISLGKDAKRRKGVFSYQGTFDPVADTQSMPTRTQSIEEKPNNLQSTLYATERLDIARMSACKLTRRRDGGANPMFSRLQKCKQAGAGASLSTNRQESSDLNPSEGGVPAAMDLDAGANTPCVLVRAEETRDQGTRLKESPELPPGCWEPSLHNHRDGETALPDPVSPDSPELPPGFWEHSCADPPVSPELPPGFWEPCGTSQDQTMSSQIESQNPILSEESSPLLPPGFSEPHDDSSQESPRLPPGFCEPSAAERSELSPDLPPGFWEPSGNRKVFASPESTRTKQKKFLAKGLQENWSYKDFVECKDTPSRQVFVANIPEEFDGVEQKLYSLVREVLEGFRSVPISATLPCKIEVRGDHAFVEFCCEAMAGIFIDAYCTNASAFKIDSEQLLAARNIHLMKRDIQLRLAVSKRLTGQFLDPRKTFYLGNVPSEWQNEARLFSHIASLLQGDASSAFISKTLSIYTIPDFSDVYVYFQSNVLAETFFLRCLSDGEHLEEISTSLFVCRNSTFLPRASRVCVLSSE